jgi:hypothetical protein
MVKRYANDDGGWEHAMPERANGEWVRYDDYKLLQDALDISTGVNRTKHAELESTLLKLEDAEKRQLDLIRGGEVILAERDALASRLDELQKAVLDFLVDVSTRDGAGYEQVIRLRKLTAVERQTPK